MATLESRLADLAAAIRDRFNAEFIAVVASENIVAGEYVNIWNDAGQAKIRKASATSPSLQAHGFAKNSAAIGQTVYFAGSGVNQYIAAQVPGIVYLSTTPGAGSNVPPATAGQIVQRVGVALTPSHVSFNMGLPITLS